ncbi:MAG TPA: tRNA (guanosine(37)-N1)-methyltransferase TrmD [Candidatus Acidoferrum sp.]|nr:tRNA (guanosine(37)-N1)-methyltransferase TrmD [Candidatus Acidoferrum sp.]
MRFDIVTIFPEFFSGPLEHGIVRRAREANLIDVCVQDLREFTHDKHRTVDDRPFGGGEGMVLKPEPLFEAVEALAAISRDAGSREENTAVVLLSASGRLFNQQTARCFSKMQRIVLICGRYEGVDERVAEHLATDEICIGDFVLSGGELPAAIVVDAVTRLLPGALGNEASSVHESFTAADEGGLVDAGARSQLLKGLSPRDGAGTSGILDCPHYTRPAEFRGWGVPDVLIGGNHEEIRRSRRRAALAKTIRNRPDLLANAALSREDLHTLEELRAALRVS